jgi:hypothetical protein
MAKNNKKPKAAKRNRRHGKSTDGINKKTVAAWRKENKKTGYKFEPGNNVWLKRSKHGKDAIFTSPVVMWETFVEYVEFSKANPWLKTEYKSTKTGLRKIEIPTEKPLSMMGFAGFCGVWEEYFRDFKSTVTYASNPEFARVIAEIRNCVRTQSIEGAQVGTYDGNIVSRVHSLVERTDVTSGGEQIQQPEIKVYNTAPPLAGSEDEIEGKVVKSGKKK